MAVRVSRHKMALFVADKLTAGVPARKALQEAAAYLIETGRTREADLLVRDIEDVLEERGIVVADITSATPLDDIARTEIRRMVGASSLQLRETIDASVLGGVRIDMPSRRFDGTIKRKLTALRAKQL